MSWTFWPLASFVNEGILVSSHGSVRAAQFLTPEEVKAEARRKNGKRA